MSSLEYRLERELKGYGELIWGDLEKRRVVETSRLLREQGYQFRITEGFKPTYIAGIPMTLEHSSFGITYHPLKTARSAELIISEVEAKYYEQFIDRFGERMVTLGWIETKELLKSLGKMFFLSQTVIGD